MGRFTMKVDLANYDDVVKARAGLITDDDVRRVEVEGWVDTGATRLVLPQSAVDALGLPVIGTSIAKLADNSTIQRNVVRYVQLTLLGREGVFTAIVEPNREDALLGAIVMEDLDMVADCTLGTCHPRDPKQIVSVIE